MSADLIPSHGFLFLRHGQTDWNLEGRFQGHSDIPLNETGRRQAEDAARRLKAQPIGQIVSSPLVRALKTAATVAEHVELPVHIESQLMERSFGAFDGLVVADVKRQHGLPLSEPAARIFPPDAERWPQTMARTAEVISKWLNNCQSETILFVAHDGIFRALCEILHGTGLESKHGAPYQFSPGPNRWTVTEV